MISLKHIYFLGIAAKLLFDHLVVIKDSNHITSSKSRIKPFELLAQCPVPPLPLLTERWLSAALDISLDLERHCWQPSRQIPIDANV